MRSILKTSTSILLAAVLATSALSATPASAANFIHGGAGGFHGGGFHGGGFHGGNRFGGGGWGGAALGIGVAGLAVGLMASQSCSGVQNVYDAYGNYVGQRAVNNSPA
jgi:hypothetical protein